MRCCMDKFCDKQTINRWFDELKMTNCPMCKSKASKDNIIFDNSNIRNAKRCIQNFRQRVLYTFMKLTWSEFKRQFRPQIQKLLGKQYVEKHLFKHNKLKSQWEQLKIICNFKEREDLSIFTENDILDIYKNVNSDQLMRNPIKMKCCQEYIDNETALDWFSKYPDICYICRKQSRKQNMIVGKSLNACRIRDGIQKLRIKVHTTFEKLNAQQRVNFEPLIQKYFGEGYYKKHLNTNRYIEDRFQELANNE